MHFQTKFCCTLLPDYYQTLVPFVFSSKCTLLSDYYRTTTTTAGTTPIHEVYISAPEGAITHSGNKVPFVLREQQKITKYNCRSSYNSSRIPISFSDSNIEMSSRPANSQLLFYNCL